MTEYDLVRSALDRLECYEDIIVRHEVPLLGRAADLVYWSEGHLSSVEFKLHDWRRALVQARDHQLAVDYAYICMPPRKLSGKMLSLAREWGIGVLIFNDENEWPFDLALPSIFSQEQWLPVKEKILKEVIYSEQAVSNTMLTK